MEDKRSSINFDKILEIVGTNGRYQKLIVVVTSLAYIPNALAVIATVFEAASPRYWCDVPDRRNPTEEQWTSYPLAEEAGLNSCFRNHSFLPHEVNISGTVEHGQTECTDFRYDTSEYIRTIVTRWDLVCSNLWLRALSTSLFMFGQLIGVIVFGHLADTIGRKPAWLISIVTTVTSGGAAAFAPTYWSYTLLRLVSGASSLGGCVCTYTLGMEAVGKNERNLAYVLPNAVYGVGMILVAGFAYFIRDYSWLQLAVSLAAIPLLATYWVLGESPRWLLQTGRYEEAEMEIQRMARLNKRNIQENFLDSLDHSFLLQEQQAAENQKHHLLDLFRTPNMRCKTLIIWFTWFVTSMVYFGLSLGTGDLAGNTYINVCFAGLVDIFANVGLFFCLDKIGRITLISTSLLLGGIFCALMAISDITWLRLTFSIVGRLGVVVAFCLVFLQATEFYPTVVRGIGLGAASMSARVGSLLAPFIADMDRLLWGPMPHMVFASFSILAGFLCLLLPESLHQALPETLEDGEEFARLKRGCYFCHQKQAVVEESVNNKGTSRCTNPETTAV